MSDRAPELAGFLGMAAIAVGVFGCRHDAKRLEFEFRMQSIADALIAHYEKTNTVAGDVSEIAPYISAKWRKRVLGDFRTIKWSAHFIANTPRLVSDDEVRVSVSVTDSSNALYSYIEILPVHQDAGWFYIPWLRDVAQLDVSRISERTCADHVAQIYWDTYKRSGTWPTGERSVSSHWMYRKVSKCRHFRALTVARPQATGRRFTIYSRGTNRTLSYSLDGPMIEDIVRVTPGRPKDKKGKKK